MTRPARSHAGFWRTPGYDPDEMSTPETPEIARTLEQGWHREYDR